MPRARLDASLEEAEALPLPPAEMRQWVGNADRERFLAVGRGFSEYFVEVCELDVASRVLDIGCGSGRMARFLLPYLAGGGAYTGFDVWREGIEWCRRTFGPRYPHGRFVWADVQHPYINPSATTANTDWPFPCTDATIDFAFSTSVFTHIELAAATHYLAQLRRVLAPSGSALVTFFIVDGQALEYMKHSGSYPGLRRDGPLSVASPGKDVFVGWDLDALLGRVEAAGLAVEWHHPGYWAGREPTGLVHFQDLLLLKPC